jgi:hypothetical protein
MTDTQQITRRALHSLRGPALLLALSITLLAVVCALPRHATAERGHAQLAPADTPALSPALIVVPSEDGQSVLVQAGGVGQLSGQVFTNLRVGPSGNKGSYTMTFSDTLQSYVTTVPGFAAAQTVSAGLSISTTQGFDSGELVFSRAFVEQGQPDTVATEDGGMSLSIVNAGTFQSNTYIAAAPSYGPPGPPPAGLRLAGRSYSLRASGALPLADSPMSLRLYYDPASLTAEEQAALAIYAWSPQPGGGGQWDKVGGTTFPASGYVSASITRFTFYALMTAAPTQPDLPVYLPLVQR